jgi:predicted metal-dependent peptidase
MNSVNKAIRSVNHKHPWIGRVLTKLPKVYTDTLPNGAPNQTMATDGTQICINPAFVDSLTQSHVTGILVHESIHVIQRHPLRRGNRDPEIYGQAIDAATNSMVLGLGYDLPEDRVTEIYGRTVEQIYELMAQNQPDQDQGNSQQSTESSSESGSDENQQGAGSGSDDSDGQENGESSGSGETMPTMTEASDVLDYPLKPGQTMADAEREIDQLLSEAKLESKIAGNGPAEKELHIFERVESDLNWPRELEEYVNIVGGADFSINPPHIGLMQNGIICNQLNPKGCGNVILAIDTSGSIDENKLDLALSHLMLFVENIDYETVRVIACPMRVTYDRTFYRGETIDLSEMPIGGGTLFQPVFDRVAEGDDPDLLIYFSDMETMDMDNDFDPGYPVVWLVDNKDLLNKDGTWAYDHYFQPEVGKIIDTAM